MRIVTETPETQPPVRALPRVIVILVIISVAVNVLLAAAFIVALFFVTGRIHDSQVTTCHNANLARTQDIAIWNRALRITPAQAAKETPPQRQEVADLNRLVRRKDMQVNCAALYKTGF